jgi:hypothetical protein
MEHPIRLLIVPVAIALAFVCLLCAGWAKARLPDRPALAEGINTALFWTVMIGTAATGIWIAGGI